jgi:hypothetical protein
MRAPGAKLPGARCSTHCPVFLARQTIKGILMISSRESAVASTRCAPDAGGQIDATVRSEANFLMNFNHIQPW